MCRRGTAAGREAQRGVPGGRPPGKSGFDADGADEDAPVNRLDHDVLPEGRCVDHQAIADVDAYVADVGEEEDQVAGLKLAARNVLPLVPLIAGVVVQGDSLLGVGPHDQPGAVEGRGPAAPHT